jgi:hypothetical protein
MIDGLMAGSQISTLTSIWFTQTAERGKKRQIEVEKKRRLCWGQWSTFS